MWRPLNRATGVPRPAKPARQTGYARKAGPDCCIRNGTGLAFGEDTELPASGGGIRAYLACRAGFAGRGTPAARPTERSTFASSPDPRRSLGSA